MAYDSPKAFFEVKKSELSGNADKLKAINAVYQFTITGATGGTWVIDCVTPDIKEGGDDTAKCKITVADTDFINIVNQKTNAMQAFLGGKIKIAGDQTLAMKLQSLLK